MTNVIFREPTVNDANAIWTLIKDCKPLDINSRYLYVLLCDQFSKTCVVAESDSTIIGFLSTFISPKNSDTLFVWQAAISKPYRNKGIAQKLVLRALSQAEASVQYVIATVTPSNKASLKFLQNFANDLNADFSKQSYFSTTDLASLEPEDLVRIGPIPKQVKEVTV